MKSAFIRGMVLREMVWILGIGLAVGILAALVVSKFTESQLDGVKAFDVLVLRQRGGGLAITAAMAAYIPARRASRIYPLYALRYK